MEEIKLQFKTLAKEAGISVDQAKYWCRLLNIKPTVSNHIKYLTAEDSKKLKDMVPLVNAGMSPKNAAALLAPETAIVQKTDSGEEKTQMIDLSSVVAGQSEIQKAILAMAESFKNEVVTIRTEITRMADENSLLVKQNQHLLDEIRLLKDDNSSIKKLMAPPVVKTSTGSAVMPAATAKQDTTFWQGFHHAVLETQEWMRGVLAPFTEVFRG